MGGFLAVCGTETVEAALESPDPRADFRDGLPDLTLEALLPGTPPAFVPILGALSSVSQLHCSRIRQPCTSTKEGLQHQWARSASYPEEFAQTRVVGLAWLSLCIF